MGIAPPGPVEAATPTERIDGKTIAVSATDAKADHATLTAAMAAASAGDVIVVYPGSYDEPGGITITAGVTVRGVGGAALTTLTGAAFTGLSLSAGSVVEGLTSDVNAGDTAFALKATAGLVRNCVALGVGPATNGYHASVTVGAGNRIENCTVDGAFTNGVHIESDVVAIVDLYQTPGSVVTDLLLINGAEVDLAGLLALGTFTNALALTATNDTLRATAVSLQGFLGTNGLSCPAARVFVTIAGLISTVSGNDIDISPGNTSSEVVVDGFLTLGGGAVVGTGGGYSGADAGVFVVNGTEVQAALPSGAAVVINEAALHTVVTITSSGTANALPAPVKEGQRVTISADGLVGTRTVTAAAVDVAGNTTLTFNQDRDFAELVAVDPSGLRWALVEADGGVVPDAGGAPPTMPDVLRSASSWNAHQPTTNDTVLSETGFDTAYFYFDAASTSRTTDNAAPGLAFRQDTNPINDDDAYWTQNLSSFRVDWLPWIVHRAAIDSSADIGFGCGLAGTVAAMKDAVAPNTSAHVLFGYHTDLADSNIYIQHQALDGSGSWVRTDTGVAVSNMVFPQMLMFIVEYTSTTTVDVAIYDANDLSLAALYEATLSADLPPAGDILKAMCGITTRTAGVKSLYHCAGGFGTGPGRAT